MDELGEYFGRAAENQEAFVEVRHENQYRRILGGNKLLEVNLLASDFGRVYQLQPESLLIFLGDMGGLLKFIMVSGSVVTALVARTQLKAALIRAVYHI